MKQPAHTIVLTPWESAGVGVRVVCEATNVMLWALQPDDRMTVLISLLANNITDIAENNDQIDAIIEVLRLQLKRTLAQAPSPPLQNY
jgi:hypothetical protein